MELKITIRPETPGSLKPVPDPLELRMDPGDTVVWISEVSKDVQIVFQTEDQLGRKRPFGADLFLPALKQTVGLIPRTFEPNTPYQYDIIPLGYGNGPGDDDEPTIIIIDRDI